MGNLFDRLQKNLQHTVNNVFGYMLQWSPLSGDPIQVAGCTYREPTEKFELGEFNYSPNLFQVEFLKSDLPGLYESVVSGENEVIIIYEKGADVSTGVQYGCMKAGAKWDGQTIKLMIEKI